MNEHEKKANRIFNLVSHMRLIEMALFAIKLLGYEVVKTGRQKKPVLPFKEVYFGYACKARGLNPKLITKIMGKESHCLNNQQIKELWEEHLKDQQKG